MELYNKYLLNNPSILGIDIRSNFGPGSTPSQLKSCDDAIEDDMGERPPVSMRKVNLSGAILRDWRRFRPVFSLTNKRIRTEKHQTKKNGAERDRFFWGEMAGDFLRASFEKCPRKNQV